MNNENMTSDQPLTATISIDKIKKALRNMKNGQIGPDAPL